MNKLKKKTNKVLAVTLSMVLALTSCIRHFRFTYYDRIPKLVTDTSSNDNYIFEDKEEIITFDDSEIEEIVDEELATIEEIVDEELATIEEIELIALITMAEAEGECELGKRLVIDTILNRVDSEHFPNTIKEVIYQPNQFTSVYNGRVDRCYVTDYICQLVEEELRLRENSEVVFFTAGRYSDYGVPMMQVENHYFSKY